MRYDKEVTFLKAPITVYDPLLSKKVIKNEGKKTPPYLCNKNPLDKTTTATEFGSVERDISVIRLRHEVIGNVTHAIIDNIKYKIVRREQLRHDLVFYIESVI